RIIEVNRDGRVTDGLPAYMLATSEVAPPVIELGRLVGWQPPPLSVRAARRQARPLRDRIAATPVPAPKRTALRHMGAVTLRARNVVVRYGPITAVRGANLDLMSGQVTALMGRNGSGKSSLLWALQGSGPRQSGTVEVGGLDPRSLPASKP